MIIEIEISDGFCREKNYDGIQYVNGVFVRGSYFVQKVKPWFKNPYWQVLLGVADCAAPMGGHIWYQQVGPDFETEAKAIIFLAESDECLI